ncbi:UNVERIFIED_CONTAM: hypothetical protein HDU68_005077 [Siphonaria sp. JEL0065]|nr:hypothetical protein HDU68_005077 [Siphonaria sp. JEL0065]
MAEKELSSFPMIGVRTALCTKPAVFRTPFSVSPLNSMFSRPGLGVARYCARYNSSFRVFNQNTHGLAITAGVLGMASFLSPIVGVPVVPVAIVAGVAVGAFANDAARKLIKPGASFASAILLRAGIVCVGVKLSLFEAAGHLSLCVPVVLPTLVVTIVSVVALSKLLRLHNDFAVLMAAGTGICGVTAISTVAPVIAASETYFAIAVANVIVFGMLGMLVYPTVVHWLFFSDEKAEGINPSTKAGLLLGVCIHDSSQVLGAAMSFRDAYDNDEEAFKVATITKLTRNSLLVLVVPFLALVHAKLASTQHIMNAATKRPPILPGFVLGFIGMAGLRSTVDYYLANQDGEAIKQLKKKWKEVTTFIADGLGTKFCLGMAMAGVGLNTQLSVLRGVGWKPFFVGGAGAGIAAITGFTSIEILSAYKMRTKE